MSLTFTSNGASVFWNGGTTERATLERNLDSIGLAEFTPPPRSDGAALKLALAEYAESQLKAMERSQRSTKDASGQKIKRAKLVQPRVNQKLNGYEVVDVSRRERDPNDYVTDFGAKLVEGQVQLSRGYADRSAIQALFAKHKAILGGDAIGSALVELVTHLGGTTLRELGSVYWLPGRSIPAWHKIQNAFQTAGEKTKVYCVENVLNAETVRAVKDAIVSEVMEAATELTVDITSGNLGAQAIENRKQRAISLQARVSEYEGILGQVLDSLHEVLTVAESAASSALAVQQDDAFSVFA